VFASRPIVEVRSTDPVAAMRVLDAMPGVEKTSVFGTAVHAVLRTPLDPGTIVDQLRAGGVAVDGCVPVEPSLEDVFLDVAERSAA
jgi:hypothetical protein